MRGDAPRGLNGQGLNRQATCAFYPLQTVVECLPSTQCGYCGGLDYGYLQFTAQKAGTKPKARTCP